MSLVLRAQKSSPTNRSGLFSHIGGVAVLDDDAMLTLTEAAAELGVSKSLIIDWTNRGLVQRHGRRYRWRYRIGDLREVEIRTRNCDRPGVFSRKPKLIEV